MALNLHKYENQAKLSVAAAVLSGVCVLAAIGLLFRNFKLADRFTNYNPNGLYLPMLGGCLLLALLAGAVGFFVGISSAGQRRNEALNLSWAGFFISSATITLALCAVAFFYFTRHAMA